MQSLPMDRIEAVLQPLSPEHRRDEFDCGVTALNRYLQITARQHEAKNIARTFVLGTHAEPTVIRGYYTLTLAELDVESIPSHYQKKLPHHPLPVARLGRLAVDRRFQAQRLGGLLLIDALHRTAAIVRNAGLVPLIVDAKDETAKAFYLHYGFEVQEGNPPALLMTAIILDLFA
ncbi:MAG: GNAT family N-acetyltransferase [Candidatus Competibacteraceae bacterium]